MVTHRTLTYGSTGTDVVELQTRLNLRGPTTLPRLVADGAFGGKTMGRVKEFQRGNSLTADGIVGPNTWRELEGPTPPPSVSPPSLPTPIPVPYPAIFSSPARARIVQRAKTQTGMIDYQNRSGPQREPHGWQHLGTIFEKGARLKLSAHELQQTWRPRNKDWCGIFCVYCYQLAGKQVTWNLNGGGPRGAVKKFWPWDLGTRKVFEAAIQPGDIAAIAAKSHHFIVASTNPANGTMETVDGNQEYGRIKRLTSRRLSEVVAFYVPT